MNIYTYDNLEAVAAVMRAVPMIMSSGESGYKDMVKVMGMLGFIAALIGFFVNPTRMAALTWSGGFVLIYLLLFGPLTTTTVVIFDKGRPGTPVDRVEGVPVALAAVASVSSTVGYKLTQIFEDVTKVADNCDTGAICIFKFSEGGMMGGNKFMAKVQQAAQRGFAVVDPALEKDTNEFFSQCTSLDLSSGRLDYYQVSNAKDLWKAIENTSPARYVTYHVTPTKETFGSCQDAYANLKSRRDAQGEELKKRVAKEMFPNMSEANALEGVNAAFRQVNLATQVGDAAWQAKEFLLQNATINQFKRGIGRTGMDAGSASGVMLGTAEAASFASTNASFIVQARLAEEALPMIRNSVEAILYGIFPIVVLLLLVQQGPATATAVKGYVFALIWIQLWPPLYALVNYIGQVRSLAAMRAITQTTGADVGVAFSNYNDIYNGQLSDQAVVGYLVIAVPAIASAIVYGMNSAVGAIGGSGLIGSGGRAGEAAGSGNVQMGNVSLGQQHLGPSRVDADVFQRTSTHGSYTHNAETGEYLAGKSNSTQVDGLKMTINQQNAASMREDISKSLVASKSEQQSISNSINDQFTHLISKNEQFQKLVQESTGLKVDTSGTITQGVGSSQTMGQSSGTSETKERTSAQSVSTKAGVAVEFIVSAGGGVEHKGSKSANTSTGQQTTVQDQISAETKAQLLEKYQKQQTHNESEQHTDAAADTKSMNFSEARQRLNNLTKQIQQSEQALASLSHVSQNAASVEQDLVHQAAKNLNDRMGQTYFENLSDEEKREQLRQEGVHIIQDKLGLTEKQAQQLLDGSRESYASENLHAPQNPAATSEYLNDQHSLTGERLYGPRAGPNEKDQAKIYGYGPRPDDQPAPGAAKVQVGEALETFGKAMPSQQEQLRGKVAAVGNATGEAIDQPTESVPGELRSAESMATQVKVVTEQAQQGPNPIDIANKRRH
ncbi:conjugal transfer protein TraG N-terminal domain-containing protein [Ramlibacter humi]|uniref:TraG N-terminal Proteobacteria domain-containing protein n=1 Tax=Ramlibacter humi TaxID=2530451 RepID=A0A4Z0BL81_9BURK|nr:conjugal transfer protein TraG N-terminal domain-containing protein [Ramlibacter humi]TFZ00076.1 hypothetical protein EZ216_13275 [Ramlibacter humi]